jgi:tRNA(Ile2) C34 agmatinyltransferase TiaS
MATSSDAAKLSDVAWDVVKLKDQVKALDRRLAKQAAVLRAACELLQEKTGLPPAELLARIIKIETDRQAADPDCPSCGRTLKNGSRKCLYCGTERPAESLFDLL